jgi:hypothetical protein
MRQVEDPEDSEGRDARCALNERFEMLLNLRYVRKRRVAARREKRSRSLLTTCANTRCRNTSMTANGLGNTALTICASWLTVVRISLNNASIPGSLIGAGASGSPMVFQLEPHVSTGFYRPEI